MAAAPVMVTVCALPHWMAGTLSVDGIGGGGAGDGGRAGDGGGGGEGQLSVEIAEPSSPMDLISDEPIPWSMPATTPVASELDASPAYV